MSEMEQNEFEQALTKAMRRVDPPRTLATFLMDAARAETRNGLTRGQRPRTWAWVAPRAQRVMSGWMGVALAAVVLVAVVVAQQVHVRHEREQAAVQQQFDEGLRITDRALDQTRETLAKAGLSLGN